MTYINHSKSKIKPQPKRKLYKLLRSLDGREEVQLKKYLDSPFFTEREFPLRLFNILRKSYPGYTQINREKVFAQLYPGEDFDSPKLNREYHELYKLVEGFLLQQEFRQSERLQGKARREVYKKKRLYKAFHKASTRELNALPSPNKRDADSLSRALELHDGIYYHPESISYGSGRDIFRQSVEQLDHYFILLKLKQICEQLARSGSYKEEYDTRFWETVLEQAKEMQDSHPIIGLHYRMACFFREMGTEEEFRSILKQFHELAPLLSPSSQYFLINKLNSLINRQLTEGRSSLIRDSLVLFKYGDEKGIFKAAGAVSDNTFLNSCHLGLRNGEFKWVEEYIDRNTPYLPPDSARETAALGKAILFTEKEEYSEAMKALGDISKTLPAYRLRIHSLKVRCSLGMHLKELGYYKALWNSIRAFRRFIRRQQKMSESVQRAYLNFAEAALRIANLRSHHWEDPDRRKALLHWIDDSKEMKLQIWLKKQLR